MSGPHRFQPGNPGGPGRPRRATEQQYLRATISSVPLKYWKGIVSKAVQEALQGGSNGAKAREWLSKILIGESPVVVQLAEELRQELERLRRDNPANSTTTSE
jgi:hypothetical protein